MSCWRPSKLGKDVLKTEFKKQISNKKEFRKIIIDLIE